MDLQNPFSATPFSSHFYLTPFSTTSPTPITPPSQPAMKPEKVKVNDIDLGPLTKIIIIALVVFGLVFIPKQLFKPATLAVSGIGKISTVPQSVSMIVTRTNIAADPSQAIDAGESGLTALINDAKKIVGADADIQKSFYSTSLVSAQQNVNGQETVVKGFQIANGFKISFLDVSRTNELIKTLYAKGASSVSSVSFVPADKDQIEQDARKLAIENAKEEAKKIAKTMGKRVGRLVSYTDDQTDASSTISSSQGSFGTESIDITKAVSVIYEIW